MARWDALTLSQQGIDSFTLMERAADSLLRALLRAYPDVEAFDVLCGPGNNGGDGACLAARLAGLGRRVRVFSYTAEGAQRSVDGERAWQVLAKADDTQRHVDQPYTPGPPGTIVVDALFGVGLTRPLAQAFAKTARAVNDANLSVVSIDVPSGQDAGGAHPDWLAVHAERTLTLGAIKWAALLPDTGRAWGQTEVIALGLADPHDDPELLGALTRPASLIVAAELAGMLPPRARFTHKGTYGHVLVVAGSRGHAGAALLAGRGAMRGGAGLVTFYAPAALEPILQAGLPEAMCLRDPDPDAITETPGLGRYDAIVCGPGLGTAPSTAAAFAKLLTAVAARDIPVVLDADALNLLAAEPSLLAQLPPKTVLTPHPGEFARLAGDAESGHRRKLRAQRFASELPDSRSTLVLKDQYTFVVAGDGRGRLNVYDGNPGMATGGTGDTLAGLIGAYLALGLSPFEAAYLGVGVHARAGDLARDRHGERGLLAGDLADCLGPAAASFTAQNRGRGA